MTGHFTRRMSTMSDAINNLSTTITKAMSVWETASKDIALMSLQISSLTTKPTVTPPPRIVTPRSNSIRSRQSTSSNDRPSTSRNRSRSPISSHRARQVVNAAYQNRAYSNIRCCFCNSMIHLSRNCDTIRSLGDRLAIMLPQNRCLRCFRPSNESHNEDCEPDTCKRGCTDSIGRPERHMDWFCPLNPDLIE